MTALVLLVLMIVCAKLWSDVAALRQRLALIEGGFGDAYVPPQADPSVEMAPVCSASVAEPDEGAADVPASDHADGARE